MKEMLLIISLVLLAFKIYSLNAIENKKSDEVIVTTAFLAGPDPSTFESKRNTLSISSHQ